MKAKNKNKAKIIKRNILKIPVGMNGKQLQRIKDKRPKQYKSLIIDYEILF
jgi:hypothetical protein